MKKSKPMMNLTAILTYGLRLAVILLLTCFGWYFILPNVQPNSSAAAFYKTSTPRPTFRPSLTPVPTFTPYPTLTAKPTWTLYPSATPRPTRTLTPTITSTPTITPDTYVSIFPNYDNFEEVAGLIAKSVNAANVQQGSTLPIDPTDLEEDYYDFSPEKYEAYNRGERPYRYLNFSRYRRSLDKNSKVYIKAVVKIPNGVKYYANELDYLALVLKYLRNEHKVDISKINNQVKFLIARDIAENAHRFTCVKFLRFVWALFGPTHDHDNEYGLFPEIYQAPIVNAAELSYQIVGGGGKSIFAEENKSIIKLSPIKNAYIIADNPENRPELFDGKIVVFFRKERVETEPGHVGVGKLIAEYSPNGEFKRFVITSLEADGYTGQVHYNYREDLDEFRKRFYNSMGYSPAEENSEGLVTRRMIGWIFNRQ